MHAACVVTSHHRLGLYIEKVEVCVVKRFVTLHFHSWLIRMPHVIPHHRLLSLEIARRSDKSSCDIGKQ
jgi:hypothetical protein